MRTQFSAFMCISRFVRLTVFNGPRAKRSSDLNSVQRVSTCDSRYIYKLLIRILIDCLIMTCQADMDNCFSVHVVSDNVGYESWSKS